MFVRQFGYETLIHESSRKIRKLVGQVVAKMVAGSDRVRAFCSGLPYAIGVAEKISLDVAVRRLRFTVRQSWSQSKFVSRIDRSPF